MSELIIKKGKVILTADKDQLLDVVETHDGIAFNFRDGLQLYEINADMPLPVKKTIAQSVNKITANKVIVDLLNMRQPVSIDAR